MSFWKRLFGSQNNSENGKLSSGLDQWFDKIDVEIPKGNQQIVEIVKATKKNRMDYESSCGYLQSIGHLRAGEIPQRPKSKPRYDDEELGFSFFREFYTGKDFSNLTLSRTFFGKSELENCSFLNTDLSESVLCWNDFINVDFSYADISNADLRASDFETVIFRNANLSKADLRLSNYAACDFQDAIMKGAILSKDMNVDLRLSESQIAEIDWRDDGGIEPDGG